MPKQKSLTPKVVLNLWLPLEVRAKVDLALYSDFEGRVPKGDYSAFFESRVREYFDWQKLDLAPIGFPPGYFVKGPKEMIERLKLVLENINVT